MNKYDPERVGKNIQYLRKAYGETQEELGRVLGIEKTTVSSYETGTRFPKNDMLEAISRHFMLPVDELLNRDFSDIGYIEVDYDVISERVAVLFPLVSTEEALLNYHFKRAYEHHKKLYDDIRLRRLDVRYIFLCMGEYMEAGEDERSVEEAAANFISLWYLFLSSVKGGAEMLINRSAELLQLTKKEKKLRDILNNEDDLKKELADFEEELKDMSFLIEAMDEWKTMLKKSPKWSELADYFLAIQYWVGAVDNGLDFALNRRIGFEMVKALFSVENKYAEQFMLCMWESTGLIDVRAMEE